MEGETPMKKIWLAITGSLLLSGAIIAQNPPQGNNTEKDQTFTFIETLPNTNAPRPEDIQFVTLLAVNETVKNAPYTAREITESTQLLSDGNRIVNKTVASVARDSEGRTRREEEGFALGGLQASGPKIVIINDPVAHAQYTFLPRDSSASGAVVLHSGEGAGVGVGSGGEFPHGFPKKVKVFNLSKSATGTTEYGATNERGTKTYFTVVEKPEADDAKHESLGSQVIEGVAAEGTRETRTIPAGKIGNEKPIVITVETWTSPDLQAVVLSKRNDPRFGETVYKLTDIVRGEPDPSLFQPPGSVKKVTPVK
jgi:hypothetical protein